MSTWADNQGRYSVFTSEPEAPTPELRNIDSLKFEPPPCPLCGSAYVEVIAHKGETRAWLLCFLEHCVEVDIHGNAQVTDKPRYTMTFAWGPMFALTGDVRTTSVAVMLP